MSHPYADRLLTRFAGLYGAQKVVSMFGIVQAEIDASKELWERQLRGADPEVIKRVLNLLEQTPREWPPNLTEWIALCKQESHHLQMEHQGALPAPARERTDVGNRHIQLLKDMTIGNKDPMFWAKRPKSQLAVDYLVMGAKKDQRLAAILQTHLENDGENCRSEEAKKAIAHLKNEMKYVQKV